MYVVEFTMTKKMEKIIWEPRYSLFCKLGERTKKNEDLKNIFSFLKCYL